VNCDLRSDLHLSRATQRASSVQQMNMEHMCKPDVHFRKKEKKIMKSCLEYYCQDSISTLFIRVNFTKVGVHKLADIPQK